MRRHLLVVLGLAPPSLLGCAFEPAGEVSADGRTVVLDAPPIDAAAAIDAPAIPPGYERIGDGPSFYRWNPEPTDFAAAAEDCACDAVRATLLVIDDDAENDALRRFVADGSGWQIWLGIVDWHEEGDWRTLAFEPVGFTAWRDGEPNDAGSAGEDCAVLIARADARAHEGRWNDVRCELERAYVCEWPARSNQDARASIEGSHLQGDSHEGTDVLPRDHGRTRHGARRMWRRHH
jgi:hypothetical protein